MTSSTLTLDRAGRGLRRDVVGRELDDHVVRAGGGRRGDVERRRPGAGRRDRDAVHWRRRDRDRRRSRCRHPSPRRRPTPPCRRGSPASRGTRRPAKPGRHRSVIAMSSTPVMLSDPVGVGRHDPDVDDRLVVDGRRAGSPPPGTCRPGCSRRRRRSRPARRCSCRTRRPGTAGRPAAHRRCRRRGRPACRRR